MGEKGNPPDTSEGTTPPPKPGASKVAGTEEKGPAGPLGVPLDFGPLVPEDFGDTPSEADHRASGQITDEKGEYGDVRMSDPDAVDKSGWSSGELSDQPGSHDAGRYPNEPPGGGRGQITDDSGGYGPERRSR